MIKAFFYFYFHLFMFVWRVFDITKSIAEGLFLRIQQTQSAGMIGNKIMEKPMAVVKSSLVPKRL